jgi:hypothetical protein
MRALQPASCALTFASSDAEVGDSGARGAAAAPVTRAIDGAPSQDGHGRFQPADAPPEPLQLQLFRSVRDCQLRVTLSHHGDRYTVE